MIADTNQKNDFFFFTNDYNNAIIHISSTFSYDGPVRSVQEQETTKIHSSDILTREKNPIFQVL